MSLQIKKYDTKNFLNFCSKIFLPSLKINVVCFHSRKQDVNPEPHYSHYHYQYHLHTCIALGWISGVHVEFERTYLYIPSQATIPPTDYISVQKLINLDLVMQGSHVNILNILIISRFYRHIYDKYYELQQVLMGRLNTYWQFIPPASRMSP